MNFEYDLVAQGGSHLESGRIDHSQERDTVDCRVGQRVKRVGKQDGRLRQPTERPSY